MKSYELLEKKFPLGNEEGRTLKEMITLVENFIDSRLVNFQFSAGEECIGYKTQLHSHRFYRTLPQERLILAYINLYRKEHRDEYLNRAISIGRYLARSIEPEGIIPFHLPFFFLRMRELVLIGQ